MSTIIRLRLLFRCVGFAVTLRSIAVTARRAIVTIATARAVVAVAALHHRGRAFFQLVDADRHVAQDVFMDAHLALHFLHGIGRRVDVHQREMRLAVLVDAVLKRLQAPAFHFFHLAAAFFKDALEMRHKLFGLLGRNVLACKEHVLVISHCFLPFVSLYRPFSG
jgi:hypothetical protein